MRSPSRRRLAGPLAVVLALLTSACAENVEQGRIEEASTRPQDYLEPIGRYAVEVDALWNLVFWIAVGVFILVMGLLVAVTLRYRERADDDGVLPKQVHGNPRLEAVWTVIPAVILAVIAVPTVRTIFDLATPPDEGEEPLYVSVIGHQFWWEYEYADFEGPDGAILNTANEMVIPTGRDVLLSLDSADVIHSFWVPKLSGKQDAVPGRTNPLKIRADEPGEYLGQCAEFCGLSHANMRLRVIAVEPAEFDRWVEQQTQPQEDPSDQLARQGQEQFVSKGCTACHTVRGFDAARGQAGPDLTYFSDREWFAGAIFENTDENLREWLRDPPAMKPMRPGIGIGMPDLGLTDEEIDQLVAYLRTLRSGGS